LYEKEGRVSMKIKNNPPKSSEKRNTDFYRLLVEQAGDGIAIIQDSLLKYVNPSLSKMSGYSQEELLNTSFANYLVTDELNQIVQRCSQRMSGKDVPRIYETTMKHKDGRKFHAEVNAGLITYQGKPADLVTIRNITERKRAEERLNETLGKLRKMMGAVVQAITLTVESRDPTTAGHQRRVADLSRGIATEMGLSPEKIDAIRMAASMHDLGKISIPADILNKPGHLSEYEFRMIQTHPRVAYDILKTIEFPGPIAQIVLQHHERMDGSGYPQNLKGKDTLLEARILSVADVVEAMVSHRPYRSAHRLEEALDEISKNRGVIYDPNAVDCCLKLFNEKNYCFK
jgi:PAS domain S-box-containing protein